MTGRSDYEEEGLDRLLYKGATARQLIELVEAARALHLAADAAFDPADPDMAELNDRMDRVWAALKNCDGLKA